MLDVIATGPEMGQRWRRQLAEDAVVRLGRMPKNGWDVPWDMRVSREHADLELLGDKLRVCCLKTATNAVYYQGEPFREVVVNAGDDFRIGETTFRLQQVPEDVAALVAARQTPPAAHDTNETKIIGEFHYEELARLEAALVQVESEAAQATQLADKRFSEIQELHKDIEALRAQEPADRESRKQAEQELRKAKQAAQERAEEVDRLRMENQRLSRQLTTETGKSQEERSTAKEIRTRLKDLQKQNEQLQSVVAGLTDQRDALEARVSEAVRLAQQESDENADKIAELRKVTKQLEERLADLANERDSLAGRTAELESELAEKGEQQQATDSTLVQTKDELEQARLRVTSLETKIAKLESEHAKASQSLKEAVTRIQREKDAVAHLNSEREELKSEIDSLTARIFSGQNALREAKQESEELSKQFQRQQQEIEALQEAVSTLRMHLEEKGADLHTAQAEAREKTDTVSKLHADIASLQIDVDSLSEQVDNREASLELVRIENKEQADEIGQLRRINEGLQEEVDSLRTQARSHIATLRKIEVKAEHEAQEAKRFKEQNETLLEQIAALKSQLEGSSFSRLDSLSISRKSHRPSGPSTRSSSQISRPGGTDETIDENVHQISGSDPELKQFGQYRILHKVGQGGMGVVYKAVHTRLDKVVALKLVTESRVHTSDRIARFDREMKAIGRLEHENLVRAIDAGESEDNLFLVMEYIDGLDVANLLRRIGHLPLADGCEIVRQAAAGLEYVHRRKLVHRDLKPSNLMLTYSGQVKVLDLGLAQLNDWTTEGLTQSGQIMGTLDYMAPEQAGDSRLVDLRADIYSLGCTFFEMLSGRSPFSKRGNESLAEMIVAHATKPLPPLAPLRPEVPSALVELVEQMTAKQPDDRPQSMQEIAEHLKPHSGDASLTSLLATVPKPHQGESLSRSANQSGGAGEVKEDTSATATAAEATRASDPQISNEAAKASEEVHALQSHEHEQKA